MGARGNSSPARAPARPSSLAAAPHGHHCLYEAHGCSPLPSPAHHAGARKRHGRAGARARLRIMIPAGCRAVTIVEWPALPSEGLQGSQSPLRLERWALPARVRRAAAPAVCLARQRGRQRTESDGRRGVNELSRTCVSLPCECLLQEERRVWQHCSQASASRRPSRVRRGIEHCSANVDAEGERPTSQPQR